MKTIVNGVATVALAAFVLVTAAISLVAFPFIADSTLKPEHPDFR